MREQLKLCKETLKLPTWPIRLVILIELIMSNQQTVMLCCGSYLFFFALCEEASEGAENDASVHLYVLMGNNLQRGVKAQPVHRIQTAAVCLPAVCSGDVIEAWA